VKGRKFRARFLKHPRLHRRHALIVELQPFDRSGMNRPENCELNVQMCVVAVRARVGHRFFSWLQFGPRGVNYLDNSRTSGSRSDADDTVDSTYLPSSFLIQYSTPSFEIVNSARVGLVNHSIESPPSGS
jgi:hypothetical protein